MRFLPRFSVVEWLVLLVIGGLLSTLAYDGVQGLLGTRDGLRDAETDVASGALKLKVAGLPPFCREQMKSVFHERYGVTLEYIGGCCPSPYRTNYNAAYNERTQKELVGRFPDFANGAVYDSVRQEAERRHAAERKARQGDNDG